MTAPHSIEWLLQQAETGKSSNWEDLSRELGSFTLPELYGLIYHCRLLNPFWWATTDEEAEHADLRWMHLEHACRGELFRRGVSFVPHEPEFQEQLEGYAAFLKRMAAIAEYRPDVLFDDRQHRGVLNNGLVVIFTRKRNEHGSYSHLSLSALDRVPSSQEVDAVVEAFFGGWHGVRQRKGWSREDIRHFEKADRSFPDQNGREVDLGVVTTEELKRGNRSPEESKEEPPGSEQDPTGQPYEGVLPDVLTPGLKVVFSGMAVSPESAKAKAYYANPQNRFWRTLYEIDLTNRQLQPAECWGIADLGIGLTDLAKRVAGGDEQITVSDSDRALLRDKIRRFAPAVLAFNGKASAKEFLGRDVSYGLQTDRIGKTAIFVLPSTSPAARGSWDLAPWRQLAARLRASERAQDI